MVPCFCLPNQAVSCQFSVLERKSPSSSLAFGKRIILAKTNNVHKLNKSYWYACAPSSHESTCITWLHGAWTHVTRIFPLWDVYWGPLSDFGEAPLLSLQSISLFHSPSLSYSLSLPRNLQIIFVFTSKNSLLSLMSLSWVICLLEHINVYLYYGICNQKVTWSW